MFDYLIHGFKLHKSRGARAKQTYFTNRVINVLNALFPDWLLMISIHHVLFIEHLL